MMVMMVHCIGRIDDGGYDQCSAMVIDNGGDESSVMT